MLFSFHVRLSHDVCLVYSPQFRSSFPNASRQPLRPKDSAAFFIMSLERMILRASGAPRGQRICILEKNGKIGKLRLHNGR